ncbi:1-deoxy-D-xylulose-5-phosphate synthase [Prevotella communis]|uniref:1-deoxy-D-xylulose-5-phosphate synthase n=1 Tax=Prevotella communis TaxID=2913614 RepID=A0A1H0EWP7_9BACT|nr:1-deoxy-D-xylulose-5-phosphate synthase [Prevotella communis]UKK57367.1 1-deoxy-D-xylulose-5-phosphate synthase [Prevotella communis]UKK60057.1 1-deoxy-D-xylulose-5-phosphate synthase [Prevotella communis]UKK68029.1 1-deoxy-D-xylulose-5-phosphate synthase [Prevotella communis]UKK69834.1 1-deoxy-D-xylulose-5-phosphate synthase [Prevotella communis]SDN86792.1 1-deoxy-D-xylulose-5-phosphate synthase [Prevotella communis]
MEHKDLKILKTIDSPSQLRLVKPELLPQLCKELREDIIQELSVNPGHLASSLGVVELTVALHYVFNTPQDRIVWDVGHQAYGHKILTGRRDNFDTNRKLHGIRPFPTPEESEYDSFICGHASNSISAALGMAVASKGNYNVVAVIGDGAMSGGLAFEGLNNVSSSPNDLLIILNDNDMSIDRSVGGMKEYLLRLSTNKTYNSLRYKASKWLVEQGLLTEGRKKGIIRLANAVKSAISEQQNIFEGMNIRYFGPYDGHNVKELVRILRQLKDMKGPKLLHLHTQKGHGYAPAENYKPIWHAPGKFDPDTGELIQGDTEGMPPKFQDVFGETLLELAQANPKIVGVTPAMPTGCSMNIPMKVMPDRMFDVGIAEGHAVTFSAGMAKDGLIPFCNIYSAFAQRAYDNIIHDVAILKLPVVLCLDRAGLVGEDGPTHHGAFDMAALRPIPNLTISSPMNEHELRNLMYTAQLEGKGPFVIRYPRGNGVLTNWRCPFEEIKIGTGRKLRDGDDVAVLTIGPMGNDVAKVIDEIKDLSVAHYDMRFLKPLDEDILHEVGKKFRRIVTVENGVRKGGLGTAVLEWMSDHDYDVKVTRMGLPDQFVEHGTIDQLREIIGLDNESIKKAILNSQT